MAVLRQTRPYIRIVMALILGGVGLRTFAASPVSEKDLKAVFIFHFTQFVGWPPAAFSSSSHFVIGVVGDEDLRRILEKVVAGESVGGHPLEVRKVESADEAAGCQILYVAPGMESEYLPAKVPDKSLLTVGETDAFERDGGTIRFTSDRNHLRLVINLRAARSESLAISSRLLRLAEVVE